MFKVQSTSVDVLFHSGINEQGYTLAIKEAISDAAHGLKRLHVEMKSKDHDIVWSNSVFS
jgi:hypothetical protein